MKRRIFWGGLGVVLLVVVGSLSYWLLLLALLGIACAVLFRTTSSRIGRGAAVAFVLVGVALVALYGFGYLRAAAHVGSCDTSIVARVASLGSSRPPGPDRQSTVALRFQEDLRQRAFRFRNRARSTLQIDALMEQTSTFLDQPSAVKETPDYLALYDALQKLRSFLREQQLADRAVRRQQAAQLERQLDTLIARSRQATSPEIQQQLEEELLSITNKSLLFELHEKQRAVQLQARKVVSAVVEPRFASRVIFDGDQFNYEEEITLTATRGELVRIDAEPLRHEAEIEGMRHELLLRQGDETTRPGQLDNVQMTPGVRSVTLINRRYSTVGTEVVCAKSPVSPIRRLEPRWPYPYAIQLNVVSRIGPHTLISTVEANRDARIEDVRVPLWSYYTAKDELALTQKEAFDVLTHPKDALTQNAFRTGEPFWMEIVGKSPLVRNPLVQKYRQYLIAEHALVTLVVLVIGAIVTDRLLK
jgi:hypothetical protein